MKCWRLVDVDESELGLCLVDGEHVQLLVFLDGLVDRVWLEALTHTPEDKTKGNVRTKNLKDIRKLH